MVTSKLHVDKIERNLSLMQEFLLGLRELSRMTREEFLSDKRNSAAAESYLRRSLEALFDIGRHILAKSYGFKELEYKKVAAELGQRGVVAASSMPTGTNTSISSPAWPSPASFLRPGAMPG